MPSPEGEECFAKDVKWARTVADKCRAKGGDTLRHLTTRKRAGAAGVEQQNAATLFALLAFSRGIQRYFESRVLKGAGAPRVAPLPHGLLLRVRPRGFVCFAP